MIQLNNLSHITDTLEKNVQAPAVSWEVTLSEEKGHTEKIINRTLAVNKLIKQGIIKPSYLRSPKKQS